MTIEAKIIADSVSPWGPRITTMQLRYPRFIHAEFMTHRVFSRNASSSRAIPVQKQIDMIREDTAMPSHWGKNQSGMQAEEESDSLIDLHGGEWEATPVEAWEYARDNAIAVAQAFHDAGYHKQVVNRILEPFSHISVVVTATDYDNFFFLRRHKDAQPEIKILADKMFYAMKASNPVRLSTNAWHLPYVRDEEIEFWCNNATEEEDWEGMPTGLGAYAPLVKMSVARCARVSYLTHEGLEPDIRKDFDLYDRLVGSTPLHASPAEHQAKPDDVIFDSVGLRDWGNPALHGNLTGFIQFRKLLPEENQTPWNGLNEFD